MYVSRGDLLCRDKEHDVAFGLVELTGWAGVGSCTHVNVVYHTSAVGDG